MKSQIEKICSQRKYVNIFNSQNVTYIVGTVQSKMNIEFYKVSDVTALLSVQRTFVQLSTKAIKHKPKSFETMSTP